MTTHRHVGTALVAVACVCASRAAAQPASEAPSIIDRITVSASPLAREALDMAQPATVLRGDALRRSAAASLGDTLASQIGVSSSYFGAGAGRPIIRGLDGPRVRVLQDGLGTLDASTISPDHQVTSEALAAEQIEVLRGPASLLYGGGAIGGVVNVVTHSIPQRMPRASLTGSLDLRGQTVNDETAIAASLDAGLQRVAIHADGFHRRQKDYRIPGNAVLGDPDSASGRLPNSFVEQSGGTFGASWIGSRGFIGASAALVDAQYGIPTEERPFIGLHQKRLGIAGELDEPFGGAQRARVRAVATDYQHIEYEEDKTQGTKFTNRGFEARGDVALTPWSGWSSVVGVQGYSHELAAEGEEAVIPRTRAYGVGIFALAERDLAAGWRGDVGLRVDQERRDPEGDLPTRTFTPFQAALGLVHRTDGGGVAALSMTYAERAPSIEELFSNGPHHATATFDIGDPGLGKEKSVNVDFSLRKVAGAWTGTLNLFASETRGFVYGAFVDADEDGVADRVDDEGSPDPDGELVVQVFTPGRARFYGIEGEIAYRPAQDGPFVRGFGDYVRGRLRNAGNLPRMPAGRLGVEFGYAIGPFSAVATVVHGFRQDRVAPLESPTPSYTRLDLEASYRLQSGSVTWLLFARGLNLTDEDIRVATSYLKNVAPLPGRSLLIGLRAEL